MNFDEAGKIKILKNELKEIKRTCEDLVEVKSNLWLENIKLKDEIERLKDKDKDTTSIKLKEIQSECNRKILDMKVQTDTYFEEKMYYKQELEVAQNEIEILKTNVQKFEIKEKELLEKLKSVEEKLARKEVELVTMQNHFEFLKTRDKKHVKKFDLNSNPFCRRRESSSSVSDNGNF